jgi:hypothetical protein
MKSLLFSYLNGLSQLCRKKDDPDIIVMFVFIAMQIFFILCVSIISGIRIPTSGELGNKFLVRLIIGLLFWGINKYVFGIRESN